MMFTNITTQTDLNLTILVNNLTFSLININFHRYLQQNVIKNLENLEKLQILDTLNVSNNIIPKIENIGKCKNRKGEGW